MRFESLQYVRGLAAIAVVIFHILTQLISLGFDTFAWGSEGVDLFFVLSGFLMMVLPTHDHIRPIEFFKRRLIRVVPLYWILTLVIFGISLIIPSLLNSTSPDFVNLIKSLLFIPFKNQASNNSFYPMLIPGWTLNFEMMFYLLFSFTLLFKYKFRLVLITLLISLLFYAHSIITYQIFEFYQNYHIFEFFLGVLIASLYRKKIILNLLPAKVIMTLSVILFFYPASDSFSKYLIIFSSFGLIYSLISLEHHGVLFSNKALLNLGNYSYSLYLTHVFVVAGVRIIFELSGFQLNPYLYFLIVIILSLVVSRVVYKLIEVPVTRFLLKSR